MADTCTWTGKSGQKYKYHVRLIGTQFKDEPGNYVFAKVLNQRWVPVYIGQGNLAGRLNNWSADHHKAGCIDRQGATHVHAHLSSKNESVRISEESDLIANYSPFCNG
ncbi:MAG: hypothetical protein ACR2QC_01695 [Gammaproteobacteria bacterium]